MTTFVAVPPPGFKIAPNAVRGARVLARPDAMQDGHWKPTDAEFMHSPQIGLRHRWQEMPVIRSGWR
jgi:hypothetical protein